MNGDQMQISQVSRWLTDCDTIFLSKMAEGRVVFITSDGENFAGPAFNVFVRVN